MGIAGTHSRIATNESLVVATPEEPG